MFVWIAAIPILLLAASLWRRAHYHDLIRFVDHTREVRSRFGTCLFRSTTPRPAAWYVLTGEPNYLAQVDVAAAKSSAIVHRLAELTQTIPFSSATSSNSSR